MPHSTKSITQEKAITDALRIHVEVNSSRGSFQVRISRKVAQQLIKDDPEGFTLLTTLDEFKAVNQVWFVTRGELGDEPVYICSA